MWVLDVFFLCVCGGGEVLVERRTGWGEAGVQLRLSWFLLASEVRYFLNPSHVRGPPPVVMPAVFRHAWTGDRWGGGQVCVCVGGCLGGACDSDVNLTGLGLKQMLERFSVFIRASGTLGQCDRLEGDIETCSQQFNMNQFMECDLIQKSIIHEISKESH